MTIWELASIDDYYPDHVICQWVNRPSVQDFHTALKKENRIPVEETLENLYERCFYERGQYLPYLEIRETEVIEN